MKEYLKWLFIGLLLGIGISVGWRASDYYIANYILNEERPEDFMVVEYPQDLEIHSSRLVKTPLAYQVVGYVENPSDTNYRKIFINASINDGNEKIDFCEGVVFPVKEGTDFKLTCDVGHTQYPNAKLGKVKIVSGFVDEPT